MNQMETQVHSFLYQSNFIASGYLVNFLRDNCPLAVGIKIKIKDLMFRDGISIRNVAHPVNLVSTECVHHLHEYLQ